MGRPAEKLSKMRTKNCSSNVATKKLLEILTRQ